MVNEQKSENVPERKTLTIDYDAWHTLNQASTQSGNSITFILSEFTKALQSVLDCYPHGRISIMSIFYGKDEKHQDLVLTHVAPIYCGQSAWVEGLLNDDESDKLENDVMRVGIEKMKQLEK